METQKLDSQEIDLTENKQADKLVNPKNSASVDGVELSEGTADDTNIIEENQQPNEPFTASKPSARRLGKSQDNKLSYTQIYVNKFILNNL